MFDGVAAVDFLVVAIKTLGIHIVAEAEGREGSIVELIQALTCVLTRGAVVEGDGNERLGREMTAHPDVSVGVLL